MTVHCHWFGTRSVGNFIIKEPKRAGDEPH